ASTVTPAFLFAAPIRDPSSGLRGVLALRWRADRLLESMRQAVPDTRARLALVSENGRWLVGEEGEGGWRFRHPEVAQERFDQVHARVWETMQSSDGSDTLEVDGGLWMQGAAVLPRRGVTSRASFEDPLPAIEQRDQHRVWRIGYFLPKTVLRERAGSLVLPFRGGAIVLLAVFAAGFSYQDLRLRSALRRLSESERRTAEQLAFSEALVDGLGVPLFVKDLRGRILRCNAAFSRLTGHELDACAGLDAAGFSPAESAGRHTEMSARAMATRQAVSYDSQVIDGNGATRAVIVTKAPLVGLDGEVTGEVGALHDVSERQRTENELRLAARFFEHSNEGILICDAADRIVRVNPAFTEITGYSADEVVGRQPTFLRATTPHGEGATEMERALSGPGTWQGELVNRRKGGTSFPSWLSVSVVRDDAGQVSGYVSIFSDITERRAHEDRVRWLAHHDFVTGLANRNLLIDRAELALRRTAREGRQVALLAIDLDRFKAVNDLMGHAAGDRLLRLVAERLEGVVRQTDTVARVGGDEFVVMLPDVSRPEYVEHVAEKILAALQQPFELEEGRAVIGACVGASICPRDGASLEELLQVADAEMYRAKRAGRNGFRIAEEAVRQAYAPV
ncbi:MAG TPA: diguanylate cyclase, partial [Thermoanaerobaculia bacterium]|nr:diguanylate cyclase [Thermoanaerobaculia bacterium]